MATTDDIDNLSGPELSNAVAREVMGWIEGSEIDHRNRRWWLSSDGDNIRSLDCWNPQNDRNDAYLVLKLCEELGLERPILWMIFRGFDRTGNRPASVSEWNGWKLLTIDPAIICRAALRAVREERK